MNSKEFLKLTNPQSIAANQRGELSPSQRKLRQGMIRQQLVGGAFFLLFIAGLTLFGLIKEGWGGNPIDRTGLFVFSGMMSFAVLLVIGLASVGSISFYLSMTGDIAQAEGRVIWKGYYVAEIPGRTLNTPYSVPIDLTPGPYRFYFIQRTGRLLSAEPLQANEAQFVEMVMPLSPPPANELPPIAKTNVCTTGFILLGFVSLLLFLACPLALAANTPQDIPLLALIFGTFTVIYGLIFVGIWWSTRKFYGIGRAYTTDLPAGNQLLYALAVSLGFNQADLAANRSGRITQRQNWRLIRSVIFSFLSSIAVFLFAIAATFGAIANNSQNLPPNILGLICPVLVILLIFLTAIGLLFYSLNRLYDTLTGHVQVTIGQIYKRMSGGRSATFYIGVHFQPAGHAQFSEFEVDYPTYQAFLEGHFYRLYHTPRSKKLLTAEPISTNS